MESGSQLLSADRMQFTLRRMCHELVENHDGFEDTCIVGIQSRGALLSDRLMKYLNEMGYPKIPYGKLDITFYRDDFRTRKEPLTAHQTEMNFLVEDKKVILIDDVLYTGRTIQAALTALQHFGRPREVELMVLVDRRFNRQLPLQADYKGIIVDSLDEAYVKVEWNAIDGADGVKIFSGKLES